MPEPLTVIVPTFNEERNIRDCLESVKWADEIFVVDSFSSDTTLDICQEYTDRIVQHEYINSATQKNWAIPQATHKWVLIVDSDERVSPELRESVEKALEDPQGYDGFFIKRKSFFLDRLMKHGGWERDYIVRLFNKERSRYQDKEVHACVEVEGRVGRLKGPLYHYTYRDLDHYSEKFNRYTRWASGDLETAGKTASWTNLAIRPWARFLKMYVLRLGFLEGRHGLVLSSLAAFSVFMKYARLWEKEVNRNAGAVDTARQEPKPTAIGATHQNSRGKS